MKALTLKLIFQFFCFCSATLLAAESSPSVDTVLGKYTVAIGGKEAWTKVQSRTITADLELFGTKTEWKLQAKAPNKRRTEADLGPLGVAVDGFDGTTAWNKTQ